MNSMRLLIILTLVLYETQRAQSFKHLKFLQSLLASKLLAPEQTDFNEEIYTVHTCEELESGCDGSAISELNNQQYSTNENPIFNENEHAIPGGNPVDNPVDNAGVIYEINTEPSPEKEYESVYDKDMNTAWLLGEDTSVKQPSDASSGTTPVPDGKNHIVTIKEKIRNKINALKSKLQLINRKLKPVIEIVHNDYDENHSNTAEYTTSTTTTTTTAEVKPIAANEPVITGTGAAEGGSGIFPARPVYAEEPVVIPEKPIAVEPIDVQVIVNGPRSTVGVTPTHNDTVPPANGNYASPNAFWVNDCPPPPPNRQVNYQPDFQYAMNPPFPARQLTLGNTPYNWPVYRNQQNFVAGAGRPTNTKVPAVQWINVYNGDSKPIIYSNPKSQATGRPAALFEQAVSGIGSVPTNKYADTPLVFNYASFRQPPYENQRLINYGAERVVNYFGAGANQPIIPGQMDQRINFEQDNSKHQRYPENIPTYVGGGTSGSAIPNSGIAYSSPSPTSPISAIASTDSLRSPIPANEYADKAQEFNNGPYRQPAAYQNQRLNYGAEQTVNNFRVGADQPIVPERANQMIYFGQANSNPQQYAENTQSYSTETSGSAIPNADKAQEFNNGPYRQPAAYQNQRLNYGAEQTVNDFRVGADQPIVPERANQWIFFNQTVSKLLTPNPITSSVRQATRPTALLKPSVPISVSTYSPPRSTGLPIDGFVPTHAPSPIPANANAAKAWEYNNAPFRQPAYQNQRLNFGAQQAVNDFRVGADQPIVPDGANQGINFEQANSNPQQYAENIPYYVDETSGTVIPNSGITYTSTSTRQPIVVYPTIAPNQAPANMFAPRPTIVGYRPRNQPKFEYQQPIIEPVSTEVNDFQASANRSTNPEQSNKKINNFEQANSKPQFPEAIPSYVPATLEQDEQSGSVVLDSDIASSTPVEQLGPVQYPITYDTDLPAEQLNFEENLNTYSASIIPVSNNAERSGYQLRGDILLDDNASLKNEQQDEYTLKERRQTAPGNDKKPFERKHLVKKFIPMSQTPSAAKAESSTPSNLNNDTGYSEVKIVDLKST